MMASFVDGTNAALIIARVFARVFAKVFAYIIETNVASVHHSERWVLCSVASCAPSSCKITSDASGHLSLRQPCKALA